jgi:hypothetical protein
MPRGTETRDFVALAVPTALEPILSGFLQKLIVAIRSRFESLYDLPITSVAPSKLKEGMLRYADGTAWNPGSGKGVYVYTGSAWVKL